MKQLVASQCLMCTRLLMACFTKNSNKKFYFLCNVSLVEDYVLGFFWAPWKKGLVTTLWTTSVFLSVIKKQLASVAGFWNLTVHLYTWWWNASPVCLAHSQPKAVIVSEWFLLMVSVGKSFPWKSAGGPISATVFCCPMAYSAAWALPSPSDLFITS